MDGVKVKMNSAKERENVYLFCLNTAEKHIAKLDQTTGPLLTEYTLSFDTCDL